MLTRSKGQTRQTKHTWGQSSTIIHSAGFQRANQTLIYQHAWMNNTTTTVSSGRESTKKRNCCHFISFTDSSPDDTYEFTWRIENNRMCSRKLIGVLKLSQQKHLSHARHSFVAISNHKNNETNSPQMLLLTFRHCRDVERKIEIHSRKCNKTWLSSFIELVKYNN